VAKRRKLDPSRFKKKEEQRFFSFDPVRRNLLKWGALAGGVGGLFMIQEGVVWQIVGVFAVVFISNYYVNRAARHIPRWQAVVYSFMGVIVAMFSVIIFGTIVLTFLNA